MFASRPGGVWLVSFRQTPPVRPVPFKGVEWNTQAVKGKVKLI